jgi:hypothetical protein
MRTERRMVEYNELIYSTRFAKVLKYSGLTSLKTCCIPVTKTSQGHIAVWDNISPVNCENCVEHRDTVNNQYTEYSGVKQVFSIFLMHFQDKSDNPTVYLCSV